MPMGGSNKWWAKECLKRHKQRLQNTRCMIDCTEPESWKKRPKASLKQKRVRCTQIDYENRVLLERIITCPTYIPAPINPKTWNKRPVPARVTEISKINDENLKLYVRLQNTRGVYSVAQWEKDHARNQEVIHSHLALATPVDSKKKRRQQQTASRKAPRQIVDRSTSDGDIYYGSVPNGSKPRRLPPLDPKNRPPREAFLDESEIEERQRKEELQKLQQQQQNQQRVEKKLYEPAKSISQKNNEESNIQTVQQPVQQYKQQKSTKQSEPQHYPIKHEEEEDDEEGDDEMEDNELEDYYNRENMCDIALQVDLDDENDENVMYGTINESEMNNQLYAPAGRGSVTSNNNNNNTGVNYSPNSTKGKSPDQSKGKSPFTKVTKEFTSPKLLDLHPLRRSKPHLHRHHKNRKSVKPQDYLRESFASSEDTSVTEATLNNFVVDQLVNEICNDVADEYSDSYSDDDYIRPVRRNSEPSSSPLKDNHFESNNEEEEGEGEEEREENVKPKTAPGNVENRDSNNNNINNNNVKEDEDETQLQDFTEEPEPERQQENTKEEEKEHQKESFIHYQSSISTNSEMNTYYDDYVNNIVDEANHEVASDLTDSRTSSRISSRNISSRNASGRNSSGRSHRSLNDLMINNNNENEQMKNSIIQNTVTENDVEESFDDFEEKKKSEENAKEEEKKEDSGDDFEDDNEFM